MEVLRKQLEYSPVNSKEALQLRPVVADGGGQAPGWLAPRNLLRALAPVLVLVIWNVLSVSGIISQRLFPSPLTVLQALWDLVVTGQLKSALAASLARGVIGLVIGVTLGIAAGTLAGLTRIGDQLLDSSFQIVRAIPFIAVVPLFVLWFGIDEKPKIILIALACIFPAYVNTYSGVRHVDPKLVESARLFGLRGIRLVIQIVLPSALPPILVGIRYSMSTALLALIVAEQLNSQNGIGTIILTANSALRIDIMIAGILIYAALGVLIDIGMRVVERRSMPWK
ncbi:ABC transporter permease [Pseudomonas typographi]|uniref:ABC transporter permease n=1 Tax=Pseudomonas typographi TaxID=2715964 RepID=A0ABR7YXS3_9PSED|nr:ABC transporter permease [Pseudomonas typographi]MBD1551049.1 ABC transporter permease [Pseudomonas typographi]MBD1597951.1 ABC transporter permease [Pseudomonas typographi]